MRAQSTSSPTSLRKTVDISKSLELWPRQYEAFKTPATELLFGGATEGGKSHFVRVALISWCLAIPNLQCVLIRKKYDDIIKNHLEGRTGFRALLQPLIDEKVVEVTLKQIRFLTNGSLIYFQHCQDERQFDSAQGVEKHVLVVDEATQISERLIRFFRGWARIPKEMKEQLPKEAQDFFPRIIYTANPIGASVPFFRRHFVKARAPFAIEEIEGFKRQFIPSRYTDNLSVDEAAHKGRLAGIGDPALAKALDEGDWDAPVGDFYPEWDEDKHVIEDFEPPKHWFKFRTFDWGSSEPFAVLWWCISDGIEVQTITGKKLWTPSGSLIAYREWYGCDPEEPAKGLRMRNNDIAQGILNRTNEETSGITITDNLPFQDRGFSQNNKKYTIADAFSAEGVPLLLGNCQRIQGWAQLRDRLIGIEGIPLIYFVRSCRYAREYIPSLPRHDLKAEDAAEHGEATHVADCCRLACTARPLVKREDIAKNKKHANNTPVGILQKIQGQSRAHFTRR